MINLIVATGSDGSIGKNGDLIWHIKDDLRRFKTLTMGHPVIMGRKTWESLPKRPLPGRRNIVLTRSQDYQAGEGAETFSSIDRALEECKNENPFIIGGEQIYETMLPRADRIYLTEIKGECPEADAWFHINRDEWEAIETGEWQLTPDGTEYRFMVYENSHNK